MPVFLKCWFSAVKPVTLPLDEKHREEYETAREKDKRKMAKIGKEVPEERTEQSAKEVGNAVVGVEGQSREGSSSNSGASASRGAGTGASAGASASSISATDQPSRMAGFVMEDKESTFGTPLVETTVHSTSSGVRIVT